MGNSVFGRPFITRMGGTVEGLLSPYSRNSGTADECTLRSEYEELQPIKEQTLPEYILAKAKFFAEQKKLHWLVDGITGEKRYFHKFEIETRKIASAFHKFGLRQGGIVVFMTRDLCKLHVFLVGIWRANAAVRASYPDDDAETILSRVTASKSKFIVCEEDAVPRCQQVAGKVKWKLLIITVRRCSATPYSLERFLQEDDASDCPEPYITQDSPAIIFNTSGTTGLPKGAVHTHKSYLFSLRLSERCAATSDKPNLIVTKGTHMTGVIIPLGIMTAGKTAVVVSNLTKENILTAAATYKPGLVFAFPSFLVGLAEAEGYDFSCIEAVLVAGVPLSPALQQSLQKLPGLKYIIVGYGLTETFAAATSSVLTEEGMKEPLGLPDLPEFCVGTPYPGTLIQIRNPETLELLGVNRKGEIWIKTPGLFHSYFMNPEATKQAFVNGYFRTGDVGYFDKEGLLYVVDRLKSIFKYYNDHISPSELENVIAKHPNVCEVCVIGIPDVGGHVPRAILTVYENPEITKTELAEEIQAFANANLAPYKQLRGGLYIVDQLPKGNTGKISRQLAEKMSLPQ